MARVCAPPDPSPPDPSPPEPRPPEPRPPLARSSAAGAASSPGHVLELTAIQAGAPGLRASLARGGLTVLSWGWAFSQWLKRGAYACGLRRATALDVPVLSVGNLAVGGTGKTPFVAWLVQRLAADGHTPGILARGYGASAGGGTTLNDEGRVLQHLLGADVPQAQDGDRIRGGRALRAAHPEVDVVVLDDGFQHRRIHRDLDIVLLDATRPFGFGHLLPRGLLRERRSALRRADAVVLTRTERVDAAAVERIQSEIRRVHAGPLALARTEPAPPGLADELSGASVFVLCGLGNPDAFLGTVADLGATVVGRRILGDHEVLPEAAWPDLLAEARAAGAECVLLTRKDAVKYERLDPAVTVVDQAFHVHAGEAELLALARRALARP